MSASPPLIVTGAAGFIGSALCRALVAEETGPVVGVDWLGYAASREALQGALASPSFRLVEADIADVRAMAELFEALKPRGVVHLAAESHVDRSIDSPAPFVHSNILGTYALLEAARGLWRALPPSRRESFRFLHVSTDEVFGSLEAGDDAFSETSPYAPSSPYAATKAAADHLARAWQKTYGLPVIVSNACNTYGPFQFPEKFIPLFLTKALRGESLPLYGDGRQTREWLFVEDHVAALRVILEKGRVGESYAIGSGEERANAQMAETLCALLDALFPDASATPHARLIARVPDRPAHDGRYALDSTKLRRDLGWAPRVALDEGLRRTVAWYADNAAWCESLRASRYGGERLGLAPLEAAA